MAAVAWAGGGIVAYAWAVAAGQLAVATIALAAINMFGGFAVTQRMLEMFRKKEPKTTPAAKH